MPTFKKKFKTFLPRAHLVLIHPCVSIHAIRFMNIN